MKNHGYVVRSGLSGRSVHVDVNTTQGPEAGQTLIHLCGYGDVIGYTINRTVGYPKAWEPVAYNPDGTEVSLPPARSRNDAIRDVIAHLADAGDDRLDLHWREAAA